MDNESDEMESRLRESVTQAEAANGPNSYEVANKLDELAKHLREKKKVIDAVNLEARAKKIRQALGIQQNEEETAESDHANTVNLAPLLNKDQMILVKGGLLVLLLGISLVCTATGFGSGHEAGHVPGVRGPFRNPIAWACTGFAMVILFRSGFPFNEVKVRVGVILTYLAVAGCMLGVRMHGGDMTGNASDARIAEAWKLLESENTKAAKEEFLKITKARSESGEAWVGLAYSEFETGLYFNAIEHAGTGLKLLERQPRQRGETGSSRDIGYFVRGYSFMKLEKYQEAIPELKMAEFDDQEKKASIEYMLSVAYKQTGDSREAAIHLNSAHSLGLQGEPSI